MVFNLIEYICGLSSADRFDGENLSNKLAKPFYLSNTTPLETGGESSSTLLSHSSYQSRRKARKLASMEISSLSFKDVEPLHSLWCTYVAKLLTVSSSKPGRSISTSWMTPEDLAKSSRMDFHGAYVTIKASKCQSQVGKAGVIAQETAKTMVLVTPINRVIRIPKDGTLFECALPIVGKEDRYTILIFGSQISRVSAVERAVKKFKRK